LYFIHLYFTSEYSYFYIDSSEEEEKEEPAVHGTTPTSTSNTVVLSEEHRTAAESLPSPQQNTEASTPVASPRVPAPKKARTGAAGLATVMKLLRGALRLLRWTM
jgi:hypothetical protein